MKKAINQIVKSPMEALKKTGIAGLIVVITWYGGMVQSDLKKIKEYERENAFNSIQQGEQLRHLEHRLNKIETKIYQ